MCIVHAGMFTQSAVGAQKETLVFCDSFYNSKGKKKRKTSREDGIFHSALLNGVSYVIIGSFSMCALFITKKTTHFPETSDLACCLNNTQHGCLTGCAVPS